MFETNVPKIIKNELFVAKIGVYSYDFTDSIKYIKIYLPADYFEEDS